MMTELQEMMLTVCFGAVIGTLTGNLISLIVLVISGRKEKKRKRNAAKDSAFKA